MRYPKLCNCFESCGCVVMGISELCNELDAVVIHHHHHPAAAASTAASTATTGGGGGGGDSGDDGGGGGGVRGGSGGGGGELYAAYTVHIFTVNKSTNKCT